MPEQTIVAVYATAAAADAAAEELRASGVAAQAIERHAGVKGAEAYAPEQQSRGSVWDWLLGEESPVRDKSIYSRSAEAGGAMLAVSVAEGEVEPVLATLRRGAPASLETHPARSG